MTPKQLTWIIKTRKAQEAKVDLTHDQDEKERLKAFFYAKKNIKRFFYVERCVNYLKSLCGVPERCVNYTLFYNGRFYVRLDWAATHNLPNKCYWHDGSRDWIELTPFGVNWVLDYCLHRNRVLVVRRSTLVDRGGKPEIERIK